MASNTNCRQCTPAPNVCITPPPVCEGCECEEIYSGECVQYTGQDLECLGITRGMSFNEIIQILADKLCADGCCVNPFEWVLLQALRIYNNGLNHYGVDAEQKPQTIPIILGKLLDYGIVMPKCNFCCPDCGFYALLRTGNKEFDLLEPLLTATGANCCENCGQTFDACYASLIKAHPCIQTLFETLDAVEYSTIGGNTMLCALLDTLSGLESTLVCEIVEVILTKGLVISCDNPNGAIVIASAATFLEYIENTGIGSSCN